MLIVEYSFRKHRIFFFDVPSGKVFQTLDPILLKEIVKNFRWEPKSDPKFSARDEYAAIDITRNRPKDIFKC